MRFESPSATTSNARRRLRGQTAKQDVFICLAITLSRSPDLMLNSRIWIARELSWESITHSSSLTNLQSKK